MQSIIENMLIQKERKTKFNNFYVPNLLLYLPKLDEDAGSVQAAFDHLLPERGPAIQRPQRAQGLHRPDLRLRLQRGRRVGRSLHT